MRALTPRKRASAALKKDDSRAQAALDALRDGLYHHYWLARWRAIQVLQETAPKNDDAAIVELLRLCQDPTPEVRVAAPEALEKIASRGHLDVERALEQLCADEFACVRAAAVHAVERLGTLCCPRTTALLARVLADTAGEVRQAAVHALSIVADVGDAVASQGLTRVLVHCEEKRRIKEHAMLVWKLNKENAPQGSGRFVDTNGQSAKTFVRLHDRAMAQEREYETATRTAATLALQRVANKGDPLVIAALHWTLNVEFSRCASQVSFASIVWSLLPL